MTLDPRVTQELREWHESLAASGDLLTQAQLESCYEVFRLRFGPEVLGRLDGEDLLDLMHRHGNNDSLVYWLEFKNDEEFPARFGGIAGGSALKYDIYRRSETGTWMTGSPSKQREISTAEAIDVARKHRDQLLRGIEVLEQLPAEPTDEAYADLQAAMDRVAPDVSDRAWGHKYFSLLYPDKLDDFHSPEWQRFHLMALLQTPPAGDGRYVAAVRYVAIASLLGIPMNQLTTTMNRRTPRHAYWRIGTSDGAQPRNRWEMMRTGECVAIGWSKLGDLSDITPDSPSRDKLKALMQEHYPNTPQAIGKLARQVHWFVTDIEEGDLVLACDGEAVLGIGRVIGDYAYDGTSDFPHRRPVEWLNLDEWKLPKREGLRTTVRYLKLEPPNIVEIERRILGASVIHTIGPKPRPGPERVVPRLRGIPGRIQAILERKGQVILYGPPGTGKTYWAQRTARDLVAWATFGSDFESLDESRRLAIVGDGFGKGAPVQTCCFHPAYGYEDFIEGYRPETAGDHMVFNLKDGVFKRLCKEAAEHVDRRYYLVIDEINRGDIPRIFGELIHALEMDKRGGAIVLPISGDVMRVPRNVFVIGTMNTADRSIALLDTALRRRFGFIELLPDSSALGDVAVQGIPLGKWLDALNRRICTQVGRDARNLQVGHAYLFDGGRPVAGFSRLVRIIREDLIPLLQEYCYEDYAALEQILGKSIVDTQNQRIKYRMFEESSQEDLVQALLAQCPDITTSLQATDTEVEPLDDDADEDEDAAS
ncbi:MAG: AAA family ATPase [Phycisphaerae bacterium]|nr:AAA family ATPase [Phycisphaerae bacterium]